MLTPLEDAWLDYALTVVDCSAAHLTQCRSLRKPWFTNYGLDDLVRWPGYIGKNYEKSSVKVFCLAQIHNDRHLAETAGNFQATMRAYRDGLIDKITFLRDSRSYYSEAIPKWGTWTRLIELLSPSLDVSTIAYTNIAKCWAPATKADFPVNNQPTMESCNQEFPVESLIALVKPDLVIQIGSCDALKNIDLGRPRFTIANRNYPQDKAQRASISKLIKSQFTF